MVTPRSTRRAPSPDDCASAHRPWSTGVGKRDEHLRSPDFFDVEHHPAITVEVHGANLLGMIPETTRIEGVAVFAPRAAAAS